MMMRTLIAILLAALVGAPFARAQEADAAAAPEAAQVDAHDEGEHVDGDHAADAAAHGPSVDLAWVTAIVFALLVLVLLKFAWRPVVSGLDSRERQVSEQLDEAERRNREAEEMLQKYQTQLASASNQVAQMLDEARRGAAALREQELARTQEAVRRERERAVAEIDAAKNRAVQEVANRAADAAISLAGRIVRRELKQEDHAALVADAIHQFPGGNHH